MRTVVHISKAVMLAVMAMFLMACAMVLGHGQP